MKTIINIFALLFIFGCNNNLKTEADQSFSESEQMKEEADKLLAQDKKNKMLELEYLEQIRVAQENNDTEAFEFFLQEYFNVERLEISEELKKDSNYFQGGDKVKY